MRPPTAWEGPSVVMFGIRPVMSPMEACTNVSPKAGLSLAEGSSAATATWCRPPPRKRTAARVRRAIPVPPDPRTCPRRMLLLLRGRPSGGSGNCGGGRRRGRRGSRGDGGRHDGLGATMREHCQRERGDEEEHGGDRGDLSKHGGRAHGAKDGLAPRPSEGGADVRPFA